MGTKMVVNALIPEGMTVDEVRRAVADSIAVAWATRPDEHGVRRVRIWGGHQDASKMGTLDLSDLG